MHSSNGKRFTNSPPPPIVQHGQNRMQGSNSVWEKSRETWLKCYVDAAFHDHNHITFFACCVRDSRRQFIRAQTKWQQANMTVLEGEAITLLDVTHFADRTGLSSSPTQLL